MLESASPEPATIIRGDVPACLAQVHVIDEVLVPTDIELELDDMLPLAG